MVLVGLDRNVGLFREVNTYRNDLEHAVNSNPDGVSDDNLHAAAWRVAEEHFAQTKRAAIERFRELHGTGQASADTERIQMAADENRVDTLLVPRERSCWDREQGGRPTVVTFGADPSLAEFDRFDRSVLATLTHGGDVYQVDEPSLLEGRLMAAMFRY